MDNNNINFPQFTYQLHNGYYKCLMKADGRDEYCPYEKRGFQNLIVHLHTIHGCKLEVVQDVYDDEDLPQQDQ